MANTREIKNRIESVQQTRKITNAMYLIASTKLRKARSDLANTRPYFDALRGEIKRVFRTAGDVDSPYFYPPDNNTPLEGTYGCLVITADKGLAGAYNQNVIKEAMHMLDEHPDTKLYVVGEYGRHFFTQHNIPMEHSFLYTAQNPTMQRAREICDILLEGYDRGDFKKIFVIYTDMENSLTSSAHCTRLLPFHRAYFQTDTVEKALDDLLERGSVVQEQVANVEGCYLRRCHEAETYVCTRVRAMLADKPDKLRGAKKIIDEIERGQGIEYAPLQRQAVELAAQEELLILTGGPGTGKTTSVRGIVALFERMGLDVLLCAPTGRAAKRMGELCGKEAQTIHRLLGMSWNEQTGDVTFTKNEKEPLEADAVIVDETSMVDLALMRALLAALRPGCRLVLVGDPDQLLSVGAGNVFGDLIRSERVATVALKDIFRQAEQSAIVRSAHLVNEGQLPELQNTAASDFFFLPRRDSVRLVDTVVELCRTRLPEKMHIPAESIQVLTATRKGDTGTAALNRALQAALNPAGMGRREKRFGDLVFREGDRVMQTRNDYDVLWEREDGTAGAGIFNGDVGKILQIDPSGELISIAFDDRVAAYTADMLAELDMAYAMTVHKAQGSEYRAVIFVSAPAAPGLMVRGVLYTAITRARELLILVGDDVSLGKMAANDRRTRRYSGLRWRLGNGGTA